MKQEKFCKLCWNKGYFTQIQQKKIEPDFLGDKEYVGKPEIVHVPCKCQQPMKNQPATIEERLKKIFGVIPMADAFVVTVSKLIHTELANQKEAFVELIKAVIEDTNPEYSEYIDGLQKSIRLIETMERSK